MTPPGIYKFLIPGYKLQDTFGSGRMREFPAVLAFSAFLFFPAFAFTENLQSLLVDADGDGVVTVLAFGDSITSGVGDEEDLGGYPARLENLLKLNVINAGVPGEVLTEEGVYRYPEVFLRSNPDLVLIMEGANDAREPVDDDIYQRAVQRLINVTVSSGRTPVLMTLPQPCCNHFFLEPATPRYSAVLRALAAMNDVPLVDLEHVWGTTCGNTAECELYNIPEGLHPSSLGYTAIAQAAAARLMGIDIFSPDGAQRLEEQLGLPAGTVIVRPDTMTEGGA